MIYRLESDLASEELVENVYDWIPAHSRHLVLLQHMVDITVRNVRLPSLFPPIIDCFMEHYDAYHVIIIYSGVLFSQILLEVITPAYKERL